MGRSEGRPRGKHWDVVGGGAISRDDLLVVDGALGDAKGRVTQRVQRFGGNVAAGLVAAARAGARTAFLGHLPATGPDTDVVDWLRAEGVDVEHARRSEQTRLVRSTILIDGVGSRFIAYDDRTLLGLPEDLDLELVSAAAVLLLDCYGMTANLRAAEHARAAGTAVLLDIESADDPRTAALITLADHLVVPADFAVRWSGANTPEAAVDALWSNEREVVAVTAGERGTWYRAGDARRQHLAAVPVEVVDGTGCGDVFHGVYAARLAAGAPVLDRFTAASAAAAECATHLGGIAPRS